MSSSILSVDLGPDVSTLITTAEQEWESTKPYLNDQRLEMLQKLVVKVSKSNIPATALKFRNALFDHIGHTLPDTRLSLPADGPTTPGAEGSAESHNRFDLASLSSLLNLDPKAYTLADITHLLTVLYCYSGHIAMSADGTSRGNIVKRRTELAAAFAAAQGAFRKAVETLDESVTRARLISGHTDNKHDLHDSESEEKIVNERRSVLAGFTRDITGHLAGAIVRLASVSQG